ncbi:uncharacterized protein BX664DRAFT_328093 [Halteromyces radiatus]|uniref:uncharacterized protein n=1 Tax=Halteromyces radiatus TaxID=101107 RepID=UPI00221E6709|nr:uncharacterized protein BX664DRAFT_328093 [Halteromyces radiatus]KAI8092768.1 hypothetical protein BX664DRAFT_328093 [Halteromyces radiatus]
MTVESEEEYKLNSTSSEVTTDEQQDMKSAETQKRFKNFQRSYLVVYLTVMGADWLQGPYLYKLYTTYGLAFEHIALLFLTGFLSGAFAGTALGSMADSWGRKKVCLLFCVTTIAALCLRMMNIYPVLVLSHVLSGASTALMYSVFEAWYVAEHTTRGYPADWRSRTFATATFLNGFVAIIAGLVANQLVDFFGVSAPYFFAMVLLVFAGFMVSTTWTENYGEAQGNRDVKLVVALKQGCQVLFNDSNILILGTAQTCFECSMYVFVLLYTPAIENAAANHFDDDQKLPLGYLFSTLMFAVMSGSLAFQALDRQATLPQARGLARFCTKDHLLVIALAIASASFTCMAYGISSMIMLGLSYHAFEFTTGMYYPSISSLKADAIPEESRASVMTLLRIPMNVSIAILFWNVDVISHETLFALCGIMTLVGATLMVCCYKK